MTKSSAGEVRVGIGGWVYAPWRGVFYPKGLPQKRELEYASRALNSIEINSTFYGSQKPASFIKWYRETPDDFVFAVKGPRFSTNRKVLAEAGSSIERFLDSGLSELKHKLGPINWQFSTTKSFDPGDFEAFLALLPRQLDGLPLKHAVELRHESFRDLRALRLLEKYQVAAIIAADSKYPEFVSLSAPFVYLRAMGTQASEPLGYSRASMERWATRAHSLAQGIIPEDFQRSIFGPTNVAAAPSPSSAQTSQLKHSTPAPSPRSVYLYFISGHKEKNPTAAATLLKALSH